jgi:hypothetical protein
MDYGLTATEKSEKFRQEMKTASTGDAAGEMLRYIQDIIRQAPWGTNPIDF